MAYLIECDRCGDTEKVQTASVPYLWVQLGEISRNGDTEARPIKGGVFCPMCIRALEEWRQPIPQSAPMDPKQFKRSA